MRYIFEVGFSLVALAILTALAMAAMLPYGG